MIEGIEWLISTHGFSDVLKMVMRLKDSLHRKPWTLLLVVAADVLEPVQYSQWQREAPFWEIPKKIEFDLIKEDISDSEEETTVRHFVIDGKTYLRASDNTIYDNDTHEELGMWDDKKKVLNRI